MAWDTDYTKVRKEDEGKMPAMQQIWMYVAVDPDTGDEGIVAEFTTRGFVPLFACDETRLTDISTMARMVAERSGQQLKLVHFDNRKELPLPWTQAAN